jgi:hypothetical protein
LGVSRNRSSSALEAAVKERARRTPEFLERLREVDHDTSAAVDELVTA